jgi:pimeloyl-ACP methyl ester carboxylesterase
MPDQTVEGGCMRVTHDGVGLNVEVEGAEDGPPIAFLHGLSSSTRTYDWLPAEITGGRRILKIDLRGHGLSDRAPGTYVLERYGPDVAEVLRTAAGRPAVLVGHSLGGCVAWWIAQRHPELVTAAFLEDPPLYYGEPGANEDSFVASIFALMRDRAKRWQGGGVDAETASAEIATTPVGPDVTMGDIMVPEAIRGMAESQLRMDPEVFTAAIDGSALATGDVSSPVSVPVLLLAAEIEPVFRVDDERRLSSTHPGVRVVRVPRAGHGIHDELANRAVYVEHLAGFLREHAPVEAVV